MPDSDQVTADRELIGRIARQEESAFRELYERFHERVFNLAYRYTGSYHDAEEITHDVFLKVYKNAGKFRHEARLSTWLYRIAVNEAMNFKRRRKIAVESLDRMNEPGPVRKEPAGTVEEEPAQIYRRKRQGELIQSALDTLPKNQRLAFVLAVYEGMTYLEISEVLSVSVSAVESLVYRARQGMIAKLSPHLKRGEL